MKNINSDKELIKQRQKAMSEPEELHRTLVSLERKSRNLINNANKQDMKAIEAFRKTDEAIQEDAESWGPKAFTRICKKLWE